MLHILSLMVISSLHGRGLQSAVGVDLKKTLHELCRVLAEGAQLVEAENDAQRARECILEQMHELDKVFHLETDDPPP